MTDSHDTNQPLKQGELEEEKKTVEVSDRQLQKLRLKKLLTGQAGRNSFKN